MGLLALSVYITPLTLIGWIICFFRLKKSKAGRIAFFLSFFFYLLIATGFFIWMVSETGWLAGIGPLVYGCFALIGYSLIAFILLGIFSKKLRGSQNNSQ